MPNLSETFEEFYDIYYSFDDTPVKCEFCDEMTIVEYPVCNSCEQESDEENARQEYLGEMYNSQFEGW
jgi:hypothetical protein